MKRKILLTIALILAISVNAQKINIVGTWKEVDPNRYHNQVLNESIVLRTWIFSADGTKTLKGRQQLTYPIGGINCTFDLVQSRTDEKWTLTGNIITFEAIPLNKLTIDVDYQKYGNYTAAQKKKINAGIPAFKRQAINETRQGWQAFVGSKSIYTISSYCPKQMVLSFNGQEFVLVRDLTKMTPAQKAAFERELAEYEAPNPAPNPAPQFGPNPNPSPEADNNKIFDHAEVQPTFREGDVRAWIAKNVQYPDEAFKNGIQGLVVIGFVIEIDGSISHVLVLKGVDPALDREAVRVIKAMPNWNPGMQDGKPVRVKYNVPVRFKF